MPDLKINELTLTTPTATRLVAHADPATGVAGYCTISALPFIPKTGTDRRVPLFTSTGTLQDSIISVDIFGRTYIPGPITQSTSGVSDIYTSTGDPNGFMRITLNNTAETGNSSAGGLFTVNSNVLQFYAGSTINNFVPNGALIRHGGGSGIFNICSDAGVVMISGDPTPSVEPWALFGPSRFVYYGLPEYADNTAALSAGLENGRIYRTGDLLKIVH